MNIILLKLQIAVLMLTSAFMNPSDLLAKNNAIDYSNKVMQEAIQLINNETSIVVSHVIPSDNTIPLSTGAPSTDNVVTQETSSCELIGRISPELYPTEKPNQRIDLRESVNIDWKLNGMPTSTEGILYLLGSQIIGGDLDSWKGKPVNYGNSIRLNEDNRNIKVGISQMYKAVFKDATCYAFFNYLGNPIPQPGDYSTPIPIAPYNVMNL